MQSIAKLLGYLDSCYRLNEFTCTCFMSCINLWECMCVCFAHAKDEDSLCNTLMWWLAAWGSWSNSLSEANSKLTSQQCHLLVLAYSRWTSLKANQLVRLWVCQPQPPPWKKSHFKHLFFLPSPERVWSVKGLHVNQHVSLTWKLNETSNIQGLAAFQIS